MSHTDKMSAFFSPTDNRDDAKRNRYSVVVGKVKNLLAPEVKCRLSFDKKNIDIAVENLFEENDRYEEFGNFETEIVKLKKAVRSITITGNVCYTGNSLNTENGFDWRPSTQFPELPDKRVQNDFSAYGVAKCSECGKFAQVKNMHVTANDILCQKCFDSSIANVNEGHYDRTEYWEGYYGCCS